MKKYAMYPNLILPNLTLPNLTERNLSFINPQLLGYKSFTLSTKLKMFTFFFNLALSNS
jgi:hypothetical protein